MGPRRVVVENPNRLRARCHSGKLFSIELPGGCNIKNVRRLFIGSFVQNHEILKLFEIMKFWNHETFWAAYIGIKQWDILTSRIFIEISAKKKLKQILLALLAASQGEIY